MAATDGSEHYFHDLCPTEAEALAVSEQKCAEFHESNMQSTMHRRRSAKSLTHSVNSHRKQIADLERQIAWHRAKIEAKETP